MMSCSDLSRAVNGHPSKVTGGQSLATDVLSSQGETAKIVVGSVEKWIARGVRRNRISPSQVKLSRVPLGMHQRFVHT